MLRRKIISQLEEWKDNHFHEALLIKGARQVGKTTIVRAFAKDNYTHFVEINFEKDPQAQGIIRRVGADFSGHWEIIEK